MILLLCLLKQELLFVSPGSLNKQMFSRQLVCLTELTEVCEKMAAGAQQLTGSMLATL